MAFAMVTAHPDQALLDGLAALSHAVRLGILRQVREPKTLREIRVTAAGPGGHQDARPLARQTVKEHLEKLLEVGFVRANETQRDYGATMEYVVDHQRIFALAEEFTQLARLRPVPALGGETLVASDEASMYELRGPCLVLVKGLEEGRTFPLEGTRAGPWVIGRRRGADVCLDYDPFISSENTHVETSEGAYFVQSLKESRNGTTLNFRPLAPGQRRAVKNGDLIGVGHSSLLVRL